jgi:hypothetical protein
MKGLVSVDLPKSSASESGKWVSFKFREPIQLTAGRIYYLQIVAAGNASVVWYGKVDGGNPLSGGYGHDPNPQKWLNNPDHVTAFVIDTGSLRRKRTIVYPIIDRADQLDGNFHVLASWAMVVLNADMKKWENDTYPQVAQLTDVTIDWPYLTPQVDRIWPGLMHNFCFEHSREGRYWDCWDLLTQSWACRALRLLTTVAERRGDREQAALWKDAYERVEMAIHEKLTMTVDGKLVYAEMRLPNGGDGNLYDGLSWVNLSPVQAQWPGGDREILRNTIHVLREKAAIHWNGLTVTGTEWNPGMQGASQVIGKGIGWGIAYAAQEKDYATIVNWLNFIEAANNAPLYAEAFNLTNDKVTLQDPGNGEQTSWWCWGIAKARKAAALPPAPSR